MGTNGIWKVWTGIENDNTFGSYENFLAWSDKFTLQKGFTVWKINERLPHGPKNSYWYHGSKKQEDVVSAFCEGCPQGNRSVCHGIGCFNYRQWFVNNWNQNICRKQEEPEEDDPTHRHVFCYEHPDLVREGLVFRAKEEPWDD